MTRLALVATLAACHSPPAAHVTDLAPRALAPLAELAAAPPAATLLGAAAPSRPAPTRLAPRVGAPILLARDGGATLAYIADADAAVIRVVDVDLQAELSSLALPGRPAQVAMLADGRLAVTLRDRDALALLAGSGRAGDPLAITQQIQLPVEPIGLALTPDDQSLLVTSGWGHALTVLAIAPGPAGRLAVAHTWDVAAEPRGVVATDDGRFAFVSHAIGQHLERVELATGAVTPIALAGFEETGSDGHSEQTSRGRQACQGFALATSIAPAGRIFAPEVQVHTGNLGELSAGYGDGEGMEPEVFDVAVIDEDRAAVLGESLMLRPVARPGRCALPRAAAASARGTLLVTCLGEDAVLELDAASIAPMTAERRRWSVPAGPTGIAVDDERGRAVVWSQHARTLTTLATRPGGPEVARALVLDERVEAVDQLRRGRELFTAVSDRRISGSGQACESCHPEGRQDALVWSTPNGPRQTPMLAGRLAGTGPYGWNGDAPDIARHLRHTFGRLGGRGLTGDDRDALIAYVTSMSAPTPDPRPAPPAQIALGEAIFRSSDAQCASCHGDDGRTPDGMRHDVGSRGPGEPRGELDTPSLAGLAGTAPYYHDGRYATLRDMLVASRGHMGQQRPLSPPELAALEAYLRTR